MSSILSVFGPPGSGKSFLMDQFTSFHTENVFRTDGSRDVLGVLHVWRDFIRNTKIWMIYDVNEITETVQRIIELAEEYDVLLIFITTKGRHQERFSDLLHAYQVQHRKKISNNLYLLNNCLIFQNFLKALPSFQNKKSFEFYSLNFEFIKK